MHGKDALSAFQKRERYSSCTGNYGFATGRLMSWENGCAVPNHSQHICNMLMKPNKGKRAVHDLPDTCPGHMVVRIHATCDALVFKC